MEQDLESAHAHAQWYFFHDEIKHILIEVLYTLKNRRFRLSRYWY